MFKKMSSSATAPPDQKRPMSVDDFRRLVQGLYLELENSAEETRLQASAAVHNVAILVDTSGSMEHNDPRLAELKSALTQFAARLVMYAARGIQLNVCLIGFSEKITAFFAVENFTEFTSQPDDPFYKAIHDLRACGGTNYQAAFHKAGAWLAGHAGEHASNAIFFITDGKPTCYYHDAFTHTTSPSKSGVYVHNGAEFTYSGKGRVYYDVYGRTVSSHSGARRCRASEDGAFEVRVGSSLNWSTAKAVFTPDTPARRVVCTLPEYYVPGQPHYFDASGDNVSGPKGAAYRISAGGNFEQYRKGAWHTPAGAVVATAIDNNGVAYPIQTTKVQGGSGVSSGMLETGKSLRASKEIVEKTQRASLYAIGIGSAVDPSMLNALGTAAQAQILFDAGQLAAALAVLAHSDFSAVLPELHAESLPDAFPVHGHSTELEAAPEDAPHHHAASFHGDSDLLAELGNALLEDGPELILDASFSTASQAPVTVVRHFSLGDDRLDVHDLFGEGATVDHLLARITASQETRTVNGETIGDLVLHIHAGDDAMTPVVQTIVFEGFMQANPEAPDDWQTLLRHILHT